MGSTHVVWEAAPDTALELETPTGRALEHLGTRRQESAPGVSAQAALGVRPVINDRSQGEDPAIWAKRSRRGAGLGRSGGRTKRAVCRLLGPRGDTQGHQ